MMTPAMREDLARTASDYEKFKQADYLRKMGEQGMGLAKSVARGVPQMATGLVDLASLPFEAAGVIQPGQAVGSTKWLESKGYLPESQEGFLNQTAELLSGGFDPSDLATKGLPLLAGIGKTVWHGSPHTFDKFDLSRMGTGEGNQAFGPGLYLAESPGVAKSYQFIDATIEPSQVKYGGKKLETLYNNAQRAQDMAHRMPNSPAKNAAIDQANAELGFWEDLMTRNHPKQVIENINAPDYGWDTQAKFVNSLDLNKFSGVDMNPGNLYKIDLPDEKIAQMIDWDVPLSEQSQAIQDFARNADISGTTDKTKKIIEAWREGRDVGLPAKGEHLINAVTNWGDKGLEATRQMLEQGIPGVKYLDAMSRDAAEGTRNYVVFSDEIPQILERNGQPVAQALREYKQLESLNPTGTVMTEYNPLERASLPLGKNLTTLDVTAGVSPDEMVEIYRGVPQGVSEISPGDFITTNRQLAQDYAGGGNVISQKVPYRTILDDLTEPLGEEYIYRP